MKVSLVSIAESSMALLSPAQTLVIFLRAASILVLSFVSRMGWKAGMCFNQHCLRKAFMVTVSNL